MYRVTIFNEAQEVVQILIFDEYPNDVPLEPGQWYDVCRLPIDALDYEELDAIG